MLYEKYQGTTQADRIQIDILKTMEEILVALKPQEVAEPVVEVKEVKEEVAPKKKNKK